MLKMKDELDTFLESNWGKLTEQEKRSLQLCGLKGKTNAMQKNHV